ncbi:MAG: C40 family peptidase [Clostridia bacterium]|nr:C40 family peptidase [Clostridia bacterium]
MKFTKTVTTLALALVVTTFSVSAATGIVTTDSLNIRAAASTDSAVVGKAYTGYALDIKEYSNGWYAVNYNGTTAYASADYVSVDTLGEGLVSYDGLVYLRKTADWNAPLFEKVDNGTKIKVTSVVGEFYEVLYYGNIRYIPIVCTNVRKDSLADRSIITSSLAQRSVDIAARYLGTPYVYGGAKPTGFDCSGFTMYVYSQLGISLPRSSSAQAGCGVPVDKSQLVPGDLLFFNTSGAGVSHVGLYAGNGQFIHSPLPGRSVCYDSLDTGYYTRTYMFARRVTR